MLFFTQSIHSPIAIAAILSTVLVAAWTDWTSWRIPNALVAGSAAAAAMLAVFSRNGIGLEACLLGGLVGLGLFLPLYLLKGMAAGDVKLLGAIGMHVGPLMVIDIALMTCLVGGAWAIVLMDLRKGTGLFSWLLARLRSATALSASATPLPEDGKSGGKDRLAMIPYGVVIAMGTLSVLGISGG